MKNIPIAKQTNDFDCYSWIRDPKWPKVENEEILAYLNTENDYFEDKTKEYKNLEREIFEELKSRIKEDDESYPVTRGDYQYYTRTKKGEDFLYILRKKDGMEELVIDCNFLAKGKSSFSLGASKVSFDNNKYAYSFDVDGSEQFKIMVKDLENKKDLDDVIENTIGNIIWNKRGDGFYYLKLNDNWRPNKVLFHKLGTNDDILIYEEKDDTSFLSIDYSSSQKYLIIDRGNGSDNEILLLELDKENIKPEIVLARKKDLLYSVDHIHDKFYFLINDKGKNFRLAYALEGEHHNPQKFIELISHSEDCYLTGISLNNQYLVVEKRILGLNNFDYYDLSTHQFIDRISFNEEVYEADADFTDKNSLFLRINYSSLTTPKSVLEFDFEHKELITRKIEEVKNYDSAHYEVKRLWAEAKDGVRVPISIVYKKDIKFPAPLLLYGYGSYGAGVGTYFRSNIISLLDRGFIYAIAHIRGGDELGFRWYEQAKFLQKKLTFSDFITCAEYLIDNNYTVKEKLAIMGGSAGGMLMGVVLNERPELFKAAVALVPFVDVLNTMLDETLPLTPHEFEEWGNPKNKEYYDYIKSYCPYHNIKKQNYPSILVTAGLTDPRVGYWEAAKWVAKIRKLKTDKNILLLKTEMEAGHAGKSGRYKILEEVAMIYAFIFNQVIGNK